MTLFGESQLEHVHPIKQKLIFSYKPLQTKNSAISTFANLRNHFENCCILESATSTERLAELSIIVFDPYCILTAAKGLMTVDDRRNSSSGTFRIAIEDPLSFIQQAVNSNPTEATELRFAGGAVGYVGYDAVRYWEKRLAKGRKPEPEFPDMQFCFYQDGIIYDHLRKRAYYFVSDQVRDREAEIQDIINRRVAPSSMELSYSEVKTNVKQERYEESVRKAKNYIREGEIFQVVLSKRFKFSFKGELLRLYAELRNLNPSPYMYFLDFGKTSIVGSSPEMLVRVERGTIETYPIAGTRPVTRNERDDSRLAADLIADPKERAEHVMLVDLARNDVGRVSEFGTVSVPEFMEVKRFSHVQHMVSQVRGKLMNGLDSFDALRSIFPAGTVSGAPKIRAMEIIDELETESRGPYAGAVGYFSFNGNMDSAITIRTLVAQDNHGSIQAGAGIVADSDPKKEWFETENKAQGLFMALEMAKKRKSGGRE